MERAYLLTLKERFTLENGGMTKLMAKAHTYTVMERDMKASGSMTCRMALVLKAGLIAASMLEITEMAKRMEWASIIG